MNNIGNKPKVSIIIPLYNCGSGTVISNMVDSVLKQTEQSWELLLCNDGSDDNTLEKCLEISSIDQRISVINNPHRGVSSARNSGIEAAVGEWITFIDADDHITGSFVEELLKTATKDCSADLACCSYLILSNNHSHGVLYSDSVYPEKDEIRKLLETTDFLYRCSPWARLFRTDIINDNRIRFNEEISHSEDRIFLYSYLQFVNTISTSSVIGYIYESFSSGTLKHKMHPYEMLLLRQKEMTSEALKVISAYNLKIDGCFHLLNNLLNILLDAAQSISIQNKNKDIALTQLRALIESIKPIREMLYANELTNQRIKSDAFIRYLVSGNIPKFCRKVRTSRNVLRAKQLLRKLIKKKTRQPVYKDYIHAIN